MAAQAGSISQIPTPVLCGALDSLLTPTTTLTTLQGRALIVLQRKFLQEQREPPLSRSFIHQCPAEGQAMIVAKVTLVTAMSIFTFDDHTEFQVRNWLLRALRENTDESLFFLKWFMFSPHVERISFDRDMPLGEIVYERVRSDVRGEGWAKVPEWIDSVLNSPRREIILGAAIVAASERGDSLVLERLLDLPQSRDLPLGCLIKAVRVASLRDDLRCLEMLLNHPKAPQLTANEEGDLLGIFADACRDGKKEGVVRLLKVPQLAAAMKETVSMPGGAIPQLAIYLAVALMNNSGEILDVLLQYPFAREMSPKVVGTLLRECAEGKVGARLLSLPQVRELQENDFASALAVAASAGEGALLASLLALPQGKAITRLGGAVVAAADGGYVDCLELLLRHPQAREIPAWKKYGSIGEAITQAAERGHVEALRRLLQTPQVQDIPRDGHYKMWSSESTRSSIQEAVWGAVEKKQPDSLRLLLTLPDLDDLPLLGYQSLGHALHRAAEKGDVACVKILLEFPRFLKLPLTSSMTETGYDYSWRGIREVAGHYGESAALIKAFYAKVPK